jgi:hypothetical protein
MSINDVKALYVFLVFCLSLIVASPTIAMIWSFPGGEQFSELWLLGEGHSAAAYPFSVTANEVYNVFVGVENHRQNSEYYLVYVKIRNQTQPLPDVANSRASELNPFYEYRFLLSNNETWESHLTFAFHNLTSHDNVMHIGGISINQDLFSVDLQSAWDSENNGFYFQLFFELWRYNTVSRGFQFHNRFVGVWLNMTAQGVY